MTRNRPIEDRLGFAPSDEELVRRFQATNDQGAFRALAERHMASIRRLLLVVLAGDREEVQDAQQEVMLAMYRRLGSFRFQSSLRTFLYSLARNQAVDHLRRQRRHARTRERAVALEPGPPPDDGDPLVQMLARERAEALWRAFHSLPTSQRLLLLMKEVEGFSVEEIAAVTSLREGTVKSRLHRGRERLARILGGEG